MMAQMRMKGVGMRKFVLLITILGLLALNLVIAAPTQAQDGGTTATILAQYLRVRRAPYAGGVILGILRRGDKVVVVGRDYISSWLQVETPFGVGWVSARYVTTNKSILKLPITEESAPVIAVVLEATAYIRSGPFISYPIIYTATDGEVMDVIGLQRRNEWFQVITPKGEIGWTYYKNVRIRGAYQTLEVTDDEVIPFARINNYRVRVRTAPNADAPIVTVVGLGEVYDILAIDSTGKWYQIRGEFGVGWLRVDLVKSYGYLPG